MVEKRTVLYSEFKHTLSSLNVTLYDNRFTGKFSNSVEVDVEGSTIAVTDNEENQVKFVLSNVDFSPLTCRGLKLSPLGELTFSMQIDSASWTTVKSPETKQSCQNELLEKVQVYQDKCFCVKCGHKIITNHSFFKRVLALPSDDWSSHTEMWFCHNSDDCEKDIKALSLLPKSQECLIGSTYFLVRGIHVNVKEGQNGAIHCPRCRTNIGTRIQEKKTPVSNGKIDNSDNAVYMIFRQAVLFYNEDLSDKNHLSLNSCQESFYAKLINEQSHMHTSFRQIISGQELGKKIQILIWLMDPNMIMFQGEATTEKEVMLEPKPVLKLLYKCHICENGRTEPAQSEVFGQWIKDNNVHGLQLPYKLCLNLVTVLINSTKQLPKSQRYVNSFLVGILHHKR